MSADESLPRSGAEEWEVASYFENGEQRQVGNRGNVQAEIWGMSKGKGRLERELCRGCG